MDNVTSIVIAAIICFTVYRCFALLRECDDERD